LRDAREQTFLEFRLWRQNIFDAPRRVECVHAENLKRAANKGNEIVARRTRSQRTPRLFK
jgi:hypothetical protein